MLYLNSWLVSTVDFSLIFQLFFPNISTVLGNFQRYLQVEGYCVYTFRSLFLEFSGQLQSEGPRTACIAAPYTEAASQVPHESDVRTGPGNYRCTVNYIITTFEEMRRMNERQHSHVSIFIFIGLTIFTLGNASTVTVDVPPSVRIMYTWIFFFRASVYST